VENSEQLAEKIFYLLESAEARKRIGRAARESVKENFLFPRFVLDHLKLYKSVIMKK
jgi:glycosyltransferase involved in cell wall biosynthesis